MKWTIGAATLIVPLALSAQAPAADPVRQFVSIDAPVIALTHARVIDGTGAAARDNQTIIIAHGVISAVGDFARVTIPGDAKTIDLTGKSFMPGFVMVH
jgi:enamidase